MALRGIEDTFEIQSLRPRSALVWAAYNCIVLTLCTYMCPGPLTQLMSSEGEEEEAEKTTKTGRMDHTLVSVLF